MRCLFLFTTQMTSEQIEQQYLLLIAMLNFDFKVYVVFDDSLYRGWLSHKKLKQKLHALHMYGVDEFLLLGTQSIDDTSQLPVQFINEATFFQLKATVDYIS